MNLEGLASPFTWDYDESSSFLNRLTYPNSMVRSNTYHPKLNLLATIGYEKGENGETVAGHEYQHDALIRPTQRRDSWDTATPATIREFTYNNRSELIEDQIRQGGKFCYQYDNIGNRKTARELEEEVSYDANGLNQYTEVTRNEEPFTPTYDADGNQTSIRTSTGIWEVSYDANDRPVSFTSQNGRTVIECGYDYQGRRFEKKFTVNGSTVSHSWYLYRGYLQVAEVDLMHPEPVLVKSYLWDPTETIATRILMMSCWKDDGEKVEEHFYFMHDALKNVTSIFDDQQTRRARYVYAPFGGLLAAEGDIVQKNKFRFSCECFDDELGLIYYNYRHLNPHDGRWINRDPIQEQGGTNLYGFIKNRTFKQFDYLGLYILINAIASVKYTYHDGLVFPSNLSDAYEGTIGDCPKCRCVLVWIHGYNTNLAEAMTRFEVVEKAYKGSGGKCDVYGFVWNGNPGVSNFKDAVKGSRFTGSGAFSHFLRDLKTKCPNIKIHIGTHSLGAGVALQALAHGKDIGNIGNVFLANSAVDNESLEPGEEFENAPANADSIHLAISKEDDILEFTYPLSEFNVALGENGPDHPQNVPANVTTHDFTNDFGDIHDAVYEPLNNSNFWNIASDLFKCEIKNE